MAHDDGTRRHDGRKHTSLWIDTATTTPYPWASDCDVDAAVVGAGIAGLTTAYLLQRSGLRVAVLERGRVAGGNTSLTTAHLTWMLDQPVHQLRRDFGKLAGRVLEAHARAIDAVEQIARDESIDCDFTRLTAYRVGLAPRDRVQLERDTREAQALGRRCEYIEAGSTPIPAAGGAMRVFDQGRFHPRKYARALAHAIAASGSHVFEQSAVTGARRRDGRWELAAGAATVRARHLIVTTHSPFGVSPLLQTRMEPQQSYVIAARVPRGTLPEGLYWDTDDPYQYVRVEPAGGGREDLVVLGGADRKTGDAGDPRGPFDHLERYLRERLGVAEYAVTHEWSGQVLEPVDGVAYIGKYPGAARDHWVATGFSGNGMTYGTLAGMVIRDEIVAGRSEFREAFDPGRVKPVASATEFVKANAAVAYHFVSARLSRAEVESVADVPAGEGRLVRVGARKLAVYRDERGNTLALSPVCPHMGCHVAWNREEKTWDCPCHGSRFAPDGSLQAGPASSSLEAVDLEDPAAVPARAR